MMASTNTSTTVVARVSMKARRYGGARDTRKPNRMCSTRRSAITAPSMASHRNRMEASSSDQVSGALKT